MDTMTQACELGLVTRAELQRGLALIRPGGSADLAEVVLRGRVVAVVHRYGGEVGARVRPLLVALEEEDLGPRLLSCTGGVWTGAVPGRSLEELTAGHHHVSLVELTDVCVALGAALAGVHRLPVPRGAGGSARRPAVGRGTDDLPDSSSPLDAEIAHAMAVDPGLRRAADAVHERWSERSWTIGRIEPGDIRVDSRAGSRVRFANLDFAGLGCADWDVAACLACIARVAGPAASAAWLVGHFWNSYRRAGGPGQLHPQVQAMHAVEAAARAAEEDDSSGVHWWLERAHRAVSRTAGAAALAA